MYLADNPNRRRAICDERDVQNSSRNQDAKFRRKAVQRRTREKSHVLITGYVAQNSAPRISLFPSSSALREICYRPMRERTIRVGFDLDERCTLVKYSLLRSIFWKGTRFSSPARKSGGKKEKKADILFPRVIRASHAAANPFVYTRRICRL